MPAPNPLWWLILCVNVTGLRGAQVAFKTLFLGVSVRVSFKEISIWICRLTIADCPRQGQWASSLSVDGLNRSKWWRKGEFVPLIELGLPSSSACGHLWPLYSDWGLHQRLAWFLSLQVWNGTTHHQLSLQMADCETSHTVEKNLPAVGETSVRFLGQEDSLEKEMATHSGILAWRIPWTEEPGYGFHGKLWSMGSQRVRHNWGTEHAPFIIHLFLYIYI